jgi:hypothetical protein
MIAVLHPGEVEDVLHAHHIGRLACVVDGRPYVVPITYAYAGGAVYGHTLPGRKLSALRAEPRLCFEVDAPWDEPTWCSVVAEGIYEELRDGAERRVALALLANAAGNAPHLAFDGVVFRLRLTAKTGRLVDRPPATGAPVSHGGDRRVPGRTMRTGAGRPHPRLASAARWMARTMARVEM